MRQTSAQGSKSDKILMELSLQTHTFEQESLTEEKNSLQKQQSSRKHSFGLQQYSYKATESYAGVLLFLLLLLLLT